MMVSVIVSASKTCDFERRSHEQVFDAETMTETVLMDAVFISDLHLHPDEVLITERFYAFIEWAAKNTQTVYILGDFFHAWPGDEALDPWSQGIAEQLASLVARGVAVYYMHGNRDFLLGQRFADQAGFQIITEPYIITLGDELVLLMHGDGYCTRDKGHQWLRWLTRNRVFKRLFLSLPYRFRANVVNQVRKHSQTNRHKLASDMDVVASSMIRHMDQCNVTTLVHGHTHKPGLTTHQHQGLLYEQYVLSDWDDNPLILCYDKTKRLHYKLFSGE